MNETDTCVCGDVADEHERTRTGYGACEVEGCDCFLFEALGDKDDGSDEDRGGGS